MTAKEKSCGTCTVKRLHELLEYYPATGLFRWRNPTRRQAQGYFKGNKSVRNYRRLFIDGQHYMAHVVAWAMHYDQWPDHEVEHRNRVQDQNNVLNLRKATHAENACNRSDNKNNTSGGKGVYPSGKKWRAMIRHHGELIHIGIFASFDDALAARQARATELFGDFSNG